jgi:ATP-binding protein involved in chromosome partitioning
VGKSTVALGIARSLRAHGSVGLLDLDVYAPDIPAMLGIEHERWTHVLTVARTQRRERERPVEHDGLQVVSTGFVLGEDQPLGLEGRSLELLARRLSYEVNWPPLDFLIVDLPAGTSALQHLLARDLRVDGALVVVTPQRVAHLDALKVLRLYRHLRIPVLGGIENMAFMTCRHCGRELELFPAAAEAQTVWAAGIRRIARIPCSFGEPDTTAFASIANELVSLLG